MRMIEMHVLQSFPVTCLNRDENQTPKTAVFGGVTRARVSSQCWKRAIRTMMKNDEELSEYVGGIRTREYKIIIENILKTKYQIEDVSTYVKIISECFKKLYKIKDKETVYFTQKEYSDNVVKFMDALMTCEKQENVDKLLLKYEKTTVTFNNIKSPNKEQIKKNETDLENIIKKISRLIKGFSDRPFPKDMFDIYAFGRMVAGGDRIDGFSAFSHAISTHAVENELDYFTCVDDHNNDNNITGSAHIGNAEFNSACYYRYICIDMDKVENNLRKLNYSDDEINKVMNKFIESVIVTSPEAKFNSMAGKTLPSYVCAVKRTGQPCSMENAFINPVEKDYINESISKLKSEISNVAKSYDWNADIKEFIVGGDNSINEFIQSSLA